jgi:uncharacterized protein with ParB-like and HNH nuclease domain
MEKNQHQLKSLVEVFQTLQFFQIPDYQRGYSWEKKERAELIHDLENLKEGNYIHFTGTIVASITGDVDSENRYQIVDGQQRLTTLSILIKVLLSSNDWGNKESNHDYQSIFHFSKEGRGNTRHRLLLNGELRKAFKKLIKKGTPEDLVIDSKSKKNIYNAYHEFEQWLEQSSLSPEYWMEVIVTRLGFLIYTPSSDMEVGVMFEVINNRGKDLSELEKVKNYLLYLSAKWNIGDLTEVVNENWGKILEYLNKINWVKNEDENRFLKNCWIVFQDSEKKAYQNVYQSLKEKYDVTDEDLEWEHLENFVEFMVKAARSFHKLYTASSGTSEELNILHHLRYQPSLASILPLYLAIDNRVKDTSLRNELFTLLEKLNFRFFGTRLATRSDAGQSQLFRIALMFYLGYETYVDELEVVMDEDFLNDELLNFNEVNADDESFIHSLFLEPTERGDFKNWNGLKYFLANYEESLLQQNNKGCDLGEFLTPRDPKNPNDFYHLEHIWALKELSILNQKRPIHYQKKRLGNFILLKEGLNIKIKNDPIPLKIKAYETDSKTNLNTVMLLRLIPKFKDIEKKTSKNWKRRTIYYWQELNFRFIDSHEEDLINFALKRWRVDGLEKYAESVKIDSYDEQEKYIKIRNRRKK